MPPVLDCIPSDYTEVGHIEVEAAAAVVAAVAVAAAVAAGPSQGHSCSWLFGVAYVLLNRDVVIWRKLQWELWRKSGAVVDVLVKVVRCVEKGCRGSDVHLDLNRMRLAGGT